MNANTYHINFKSLISKYGKDCSNYCETLSGCNINEVDNTFHMCVSNFKTIDYQCAKCPVGTYGDTPGNFFPEYGCPSECLPGTYGNKIGQTKNLKQAVS